MSHIDVVGTGRRVRKFVGFVGIVLAFATFWLAQMATDTWNAACPPGVTISDVNHGGRRTRVREVHDLLAMGRGLSSRFRVGDLAWLVMWIMSLLTVLRK